MQPIGAIDAQLLMASELPLEHFILSSVTEHVIRDARSR